MKLYKSIVKNKIPINDIFNKTFKFNIRKSDVYTKVLSSNTNLSEIAKQEWNNNSIWWLPFLFNKTKNMIFLNMTENQLTQSALYSIRTNPIEFFKTDILDITSKLSFILQSYVSGITESDFIINQMSGNLTRIKRIIDVIPCKSDYDFSLYDILYSDELKSYKDKTYEWIKRYNFEYLTEVLPEDYIQKSHVIRVIYQSNDTYMYRVNYGDSIKNITHIYTHEILSQIKTEYNSDNIQYKNNYLFSDTEIELNIDKNNLVIVRYNINDLIVTLNYMLKTILLWSKNEFI